jgi:hypothetical protein
MRTVALDAVIAPCDAMLFQLREGRGVVTTLAQLGGWAEQETCVLRLVWRVTLETGPRREGAVEDVVDEVFFVVAAPAEIPFLGVDIPGVL